MRIKPFVALFSGLLLSACGGTTPPPRFSTLDPADPKAPESAVEPQSPVLQRPSEQATGAPAASGSAPMEPDHHMDPSPGEPSPPADVYSCRMHPQVKERQPGKCPICGMTLVKQPARQGGEHQP